MLLSSLPHTTHFPLGSAVMKAANRQKCSFLWPAENSSTWSAHEPAHSWQPAQAKPLIFKLAIRVGKSRHTRMDNAARQAYNAVVVWLWKQAIIVNNVARCSAQEVFNFCSAGKQDYGTGPTHSPRSHVWAQLTKSTILRTRSMTVQLACSCTQAWVGVNCNSSMLQSTARKPVWFACFMNSSLYAARNASGTRQQLNIPFT